MDHSRGPASHRNKIGDTHMAQMIKSPRLASTSPPYFQLDVGHSAKVINDGNALWVKVIDIREDEFLGIVRARVSPSLHDDVTERDVISFERQHIFGMY